MNVRDYLGFRYVPLILHGGDVRDTWNATFCPDAVISIEGTFLNISSMRQFDTIHEAMEYIRNREMIKYFDEN